MLSLGITIWVNAILGGDEARGGPFLLLVDGVSHLRLANNTDRLLITGATPASGASLNFSQASNSQYIPLVH